MDIFICKHCKKKFTTTTNLRKHIELKHKSVKTAPKRKPVNKVKPNSSIHPLFKAKLKEERIRKHREEQIANVNGLEKFFMEILKRLKIRYTFQYEFGGKLFDFHLSDFNVLVEVDGDYWHGNPKFYPKLKYKHQRMSRRNDKKKNLLCEQGGIQLIRYWEDDINNNGVLIAYGFFQESATNELIGATMTVIATIWSIFDKTFAYDRLGGTIRHVLTALGAFSSIKAVLSPDKIEAVVSLVVTMTPIIQGQIEAFKRKNQAVDEEVIEEEIDPTEQV
jgi:very-short-patch-repair endonuclease